MSAPSVIVAEGKKYLAEAIAYKKEHNCRWSEATRQVRKKYSGGDPEKGLEVARAMQAATEASRVARAD